VFLRLVEAAIAKFFHDMTALDVGDVIQEILGHQKVLGGKQFHPTHVVSGLFAVPQIFNNKDPIGNGLNDPPGPRQRICSFERRRDTLPTRT
jgi:hypothetical protein